MNDKLNVPQGIFVHALMMLFGMFLLCALANPWMFLWDQLWSINDWVAFMQMAFPWFVLGFACLIPTLMGLYAAIIGALGIVASLLGKPNALMDTTTQERE